MPWFVKDNFTDSVSGPFDDAQLKSLAASLRIDRDTEVAKQQEGPWYPAGKINGLFPATSAPKTPPEEKPVESSTKSPQPPPPPSNPIQATDALFSVVWKLIRGAKEYSFHDDDFPALAACLRIGATFTRIWFCIVALLLLTCGLVLNFEPNPRGAAAWCSLTGDDIRQYLVETSNGIEVQFTVFAFLWGIVRHCIQFLAIMGGMEFVRVFLAIEKNTRRATK